MGRIKTTMIKRVTLKLFRDHPDKFKDNFAENKKVVEEMVDVRSKKLRNIIAGYMTRLAKQQKS
jgi:small subunit ribosomal protein S17e